MQRCSGCRRTSPRIRAPTMAMAAATPRARATAAAGAATVTVTAAAARAVRAMAAAAEEVVAMAAVEGEVSSVEEVPRVGALVRACAVGLRQHRLRPQTLRTHRRLEHSAA